MISRFNHHHLCRKKVMIQFTGHLSETSFNHHLLITMGPWLKVAEKADAKAAAVAAKRAEKAKAHAVVAVAKSFAAPKKVPTAVDSVAKPAHVAAPAKSGLEPSLPTFEHSKATYSHERSRCQFLCRTGKKGPGQTHAIPYHPKTDLTKQEAESQAKAWLRDRTSLAGAWVKSHSCWIAWRGFYACELYLLEYIMGVEHIMWSTAANILWEWNIYCRSRAYLVKHYGTLLWYRALCWNIYYGMFIHMWTYCI